MRASSSFPVLSIGLTRSASPYLPDWATGATPTVNISGDTPNLASEILYVDYDFLPGYQYEITLEYTRTLNEASASPRTAQLSIYNDSFIAQFSKVQASDSGANSITVTFTATEDCTKVGFHHVAWSDVDIDVTAVSGTRTGLEIIADPGPKFFKLKVIDSNDEVITTLDFDSESLGYYNYLYSLNFVPCDNGISNQQIRLEIVQFEYANSLSGGVTQSIGAPDGDLTNEKQESFAGGVSQSIGTPSGTLTNDKVIGLQMELEETLTENPTWEADFDGTILSVTGDEAADSDTIAFDSSITADVVKTDNDGNGTDGFPVNSGYVEWMKNGSRVHTATFNSSSHSSLQGLTYTYTGLVVTDTIKVFVFEDNTTP